MAYRIQFTESADDHFAQLTARQQAIVLDAVRTQLRYEPLRETRNRKQLRPNPFAPWELRFLRVFYEVDALESNLVNVLSHRNQKRKSAYRFRRGHTYESNKTTERSNHSSMLLRRQRNRRWSLLKLTSSAVGLFGGMDTKASACSLRERASGRRLMRGRYA